jgi:ribose transport system substrate-binding protein
MLEGKKVDPTKLGGPSGTQFVIPVPFTVTKDNFQQVFTSQCTGKPASYLLDGIMSDADVQQFFLK